MENRFGVSKSLVDAIKSVMTSKTEELKESAQLNEGEFPHSKYTATNEKSKQFGGYRPHVVHKETNKTMFLGSHTYKNSKDADAHARVYLNAYADGGADKAADASWEYGLKNKNKLVNEEAEQIDELSKTTLKSYANRALNDVRNSNQAKINWQNKPNDAYRGTHPKTGDYVTKTSKEMQDEHGRVAKNREKGVRTAINKLTKEELDFIIVDEEFGVGSIVESNEDFTTVVFEGSVEKFDNEDIFVEEVEDIQEVSKDTLQSYQTKAKAQIDSTVKKGKPSKATIALRAKRGKGLEDAKTKLQAIYKKESEARFAEIKKHHANLSNHFEKEAPKILAKHGYTKTAEGEHGDEGYRQHITTYTKPHDNGHVSVLSIHKKTDNPDSHWGQHDVRAVNSKGSSYSSHRSHGSIWNKKDHDRHMQDMMPNFEAHVIKVKNDTDSHNNW